MNRLSQTKQEEIREYIRDNEDMDCDALLSEIMAVFDLDYDFELDVIFMIDVYFNRIDRTKKRRV